MKNKRKKIFGLGLASVLFIGIFAFALVNFSQMPNKFQNTEDKSSPIEEMQIPGEAMPQVQTSNQNDAVTNKEKGFLDNAGKETLQKKSTATSNNTNNNKQESKENEKEAVKEVKFPYAGPNESEEDYDEIIAGMQSQMPNLSNNNFTDSIYYKYDNEENPTCLFLSGTGGTDYKEIQRDEDNVPIWFENNGKITKIIIENQIKPQCAKSFLGVINKPGQGTKTSKVNEIQNLGYIDLSDCVDTSYMFAGIGFNNITVNLTGAAPTWTLDTEGDYAGYLNLTNVANTYAMFCCSSINCGFNREVKIATSKSLTNASCMFQKSGNVTNIDLSKFHMSNAENVEAAYMFNNNPNLQVISGSATVDVSKLTNTRSMFCDCPQIQSLDLTGWKNDPQENALFVNMFRACPQLKTINVPAYTDWRNVDGRMMFAADDGKTGAIVACHGTTWSSEDINQDRAVVDLGIGEDGENTTKGYFTATTMKAVSTTSSQLNDSNALTMTFYYDNVYHQSGTTYDVLPRFESEDKVSWKNIRTNITKVEFDNSMNTKDTGLISTSYWFYGFNNSAFTNINIKKLNVDNLEWCVSMFEGCSNLKTIVSESYYVNEEHNYDPWNLKIPAQGVNMFKGCTLLIGGNGTQCSGNEDYNYARSDQEGRAGLFTFGGNEKDPSYIVYTATYLYQFDNQILYTQKIVAGKEVKIAGANNEAYSAIKDIADKQSKTVMYWYKGSTKYNPIGEVETTQDGADTTTTINGKIGFAVDKPSEESYDYNKNPQSPSWAGKTGLTLSGTTSATNAGTYPVTASPAADYCWTKGGKTSSDSIDVTWYINPLKVSEPGHSNRTYNFESQSTWTSTPNEGLTVSGTANATNAGSYTAYLTPKTPNYTWEDGSTTKHTINWTISALKMTTSNTTVATVADNTSWKGNAAANPVVTVSGHKLATDSTDLTYSNTGNTPATADPWQCTNQFTITGKNNLSGSVKSNQYTETRATMNLSYNANGGTGTVPSGTTTKYGISKSVTTNNGYGLTKSSKTQGVKNWTDGSSTIIPTKKYSWNGNSNVTLTAQYGARSTKAVLKSTGDFIFYYDAFSHASSGGTGEGTQYNVPNSVTDGDTDDHYASQIPWYNNKQNITGKVTFNSTFSDYTGITSMNYWFGNKGDVATKQCKMTSFDSTNFNTTQKITSLRSTFCECPKLIWANLSNINTTSCTHMGNIFYMLSGQRSLQRVYANPSIWSTANLTAYANPFKNNYANTYDDGLCGFFNYDDLTKSYWAYVTDFDGTNKNGLRIALPASQMSAPGALITDIKWRKKYLTSEINTPAPKNESVDNNKQDNTQINQQQITQEAVLPPTQNNTNNNEQKDTKPNKEQFPK